MAYSSLMVKSDVEAMAMKERRPKATRQRFPFQFSSGNELETFYFFVFDLHLGRSRNKSHGCKDNFRPKPIHWHEKLGKQTIETLDGTPWRGHGRRLYDEGILHRAGFRSSAMLVHRSWQE
jgi:hypothetical protein